MALTMFLAMLIFNLAHAELPDDFQERVERLIAKNLNEKRYVGLSISVVTPEKTIQFHEGQVDLSRNQKPTNQTIYEIGSISKTFTRLLLANQSEIKIQDSIDAYLPNSVRTPRPQQKSFTFENLATHTAFYFSVPCTIREGSDSLKCFGVNLKSDNPYENVTRGELYKYVTEYSYAVEEFPFKEPGLYYSYSNVGIGLMGELLAEKKALTFEELVKKEIFDVLGMGSSHVGENAQGTEEIAKVYAKKDQDNDWKETSRWTMPGMSGAGGIRSNLEDMTTYLRANMGLHHSSLDQTIVKGQSFLEVASKRMNANLCGPNETSEADMCNSHSKYFYLAWAGDRPGTFLYHAGETGGSQSMMIFNQKKSLGIVILSNSAVGSGHYPNDLSLCIMQMAGNPVSSNDLCNKL